MDICSSTMSQDSSTAMVYQELTNNEEPETKWRRTERVEIREHKVEREVVCAGNKNARKEKSRNNLVITVLNVDSEDKAVIKEGVKNNYENQEWEKGKTWKMRVWNVQRLNGKEEAKVKLLGISETKNKENGNMMMESGHMFI
ncbi:hypothetical protein ILUMI_17332 [Ignelater luminosus]|uniref:Uncharacterized protein n=1 Tax=Ignelater luminosus TaxID=2038154 RepID=A0A8K0G7M9_IGNLU|nr:hypothetical protein ILUMI_17332 [Ignelater luminosus]